MIVREADLDAFAQSVAAALPMGAVLWLLGPLGAGKTTLARALARARGAATAATSPTYGLAHRYEGDAGVVSHVDCFRLRDPEEAADLDWATLEAGNLLMVEWPDRAGAWAPPADLVIHLAPGDQEDERLVILESGPRRRP